MVITKKTANGKGVNHFYIVVHMRVAEVGGGGGGGGPFLGFKVVGGKGLKVLWKLKNNQLKT